MGIFIVYKISTMSPLEDLMLESRLCVLTSFCKSREKYYVAAGVEFDMK